MDLARELREHLGAYLDGRLSLATLREWLDLHVQAVEDACGPEDRELGTVFGEAHALLAELDYGHRTETELRADLRAIVAVGSANGSSTGHDAQRVGRSG